MKFKKTILQILLFSFLFMLIQACSETITPDESAINKTDEILTDEIVAALAEIEKPISKDFVVEKAESHFVDLSKKVPRFAGYYLDRQNETHVSDDKLVVLLTGKGISETALSNIRSHISSRFDKAIPGHKNSDIIIKEAKYNFQQLQAFRDLLHKPAFDTEGVTMIDLAEDKNRIVIGVAGKNIYQMWKKLF